MFLVVRRVPFDDRPERRRVVHFPQVRQLVDHDVILDLVRQADDPPVEADVTQAGGAAPTGLLVPDEHLLRGNLHFRGPVRDPLMQDLPGRLPLGGVGRFQPGRFASASEDHCDPTGNRTPVSRMRTWRPSR